MLILVPNLKEKVCLPRLIFVPKILARKPALFIYKTVGHKVEKANARQAHLVFFHRNTHHIKNQKSLPHQLT